jgi:PAS domain-containing protein
MPEENVSDWPARVLHPDDLERCVLAWTRALEQGTEYEIEVRNRRHDGQYRWFLTRATPIRGADGRIIEWHGSTTDIHDRKLAEDALRESEERFARFMQQIPGLAWIKDAKGITPRQPGRREDVPNPREGSTGEPTMRSSP